MMAKKMKNQDNENAMRNWREGELMDTFKLNRITEYQTPLMKEWLDVPDLALNIHEQYSFDKDLARAQKHITGWNEEDLKMKFISPILELGSLLDDDVVIGYFDKTISATVEDIKLTVKSDFMLAKGLIFTFKNTNLTRIQLVIRWLNF
jgi:hypothetical protein